ncbi:D-amino-acid transaminase [Oceanicella sp. SM1341]|uniref:Probable branched-chain-amino-acid aminotransferase n=1 Tax=Oceanicella sp. TaxID=2213002 RepID=A0A7T7GUM6_9RHOB|nr:D-amino-acid transaminase [Oceanicella sp. SM1341]QQM16043.1 D-alanine aminotransferase 2 [Oceanicella sp.]
MTRIVWHKGAFMPENEAQVSIFDRGYLFADAIYEVTGVVGGKLVEYEGHAARLQRSLAELGIPCPLTPEELLAVHREIVARNDLDEGLIYLQLSRGPADRDFVFPANPEPTLSLFTQAKRVLENPQAGRGISVISLPDLRWARRDIKTVQLLYPSMAKMQAKAAGADDAWLTQDGTVTEASSATAHIVVGGTLITRPLSNDILHGITRASTLDLARGAGIPVVERAFTLREAQIADEAFITSATNFVLPVVSIDGAPVGDGKPGPVTRRLREIYIADRLSRAI